MIAPSHTANSFLRAAFSTATTTQVQKREIDVTSPSQDAFNPRRKRSSSALNLTPESALSLLEGSRPISRQERRQAFQAICETGNGDLMERATRQLHWWGDEDALRLLVKGWTEVHDYKIPGAHVAAQILQEWISRAATNPPPIISFRVVLKSLAKDGHYRLADRVLQQLHVVSNGKGADRDCFHRVLTACQKAGALDESLEWLQTMKDSSDEKIQPNLSTFKIVLQTFVTHAKIHQKNDIGWRAYEFFQQLPVAPDATAYNLCLNALAEDGNYQLAQEVFLAWLESQPSSELADPVALRTVLKAFAKARTMEATEAAESFLLEAQPLPCCDARAYTTVVACWCQLGNPKRAHALLQQLVTMFLENPSNTRLKPDAMSFKTVIDAYGKQASSSNLLESARESAASAQQLLEDMYHIMGYTPHLSTCNTIINCWAQAKEPERAEIFLEQIPQWGGVQPDIVSYNTVIGCHARLGNVTEATAWLSKLSASGSTFPAPNTRTLTSVITALSKVGSVKSAQKADSWFLQMQDWHSERDWDCAPNVITLNALLTCWARAKDGARAEYILREYQHHYSHHDAPNVVSYNAVLQANQHSLRKVEDLLQELIAVGLTPNESTMAIAKTAVYGADAGVTSPDTKWKEFERRFFYSVRPKGSRRNQQRNSQSK